LAGKGELITCSSEKVRAAGLCAGVCAEQINEEQLSNKTQTDDRMERVRHAMRGRVRETECD
jgi:hypothetical protein